MHGLQSFVSTHSEQKCDSLLFILCLQEHMLLTSAFPKANSCTSLEECGLVLKVSITAARQLRVNASVILKNKEVCIPLRPIQRETLFFFFFFFFFWLSFV